MIKAVALDIDNTLTNSVSWLRVTELLGASVATHEAIFDRFSRRELPYAEAKRQLIALWQQTGQARRAHWKALFAEWPLADGAAQLIGQLHQRGYTTALITGSVDLFAETIARRLHIPHWYANTKLIWNEEGLLTDFQYVRDQAAQKLQDLTLFATAAGITVTECAAVGDGSNDLEIFRATGHGIAVGPTDPALQAAAWRTVSTLGHVLAALETS